MDMNQLAAEITRCEGKAQSISIAQVKEVMGILSQMMWRSPRLIGSFVAYGRKRCNKEERQRAVKRRRK